MKATRLLGTLPCGLLVLAAFGAARAEQAASRAGSEYLGPSAVAVSDDGRVLFVSLSDRRALAIVDLPDARNIRMISTPAEPTGLALSGDGRRLYVACAAATSSVLEIDAASA